jgi:regulator of protease activity HflC (stomatin/prohibitin superfamily)
MAAARDYARIHGDADVGSAKFHILRSSSGDGIMMQQDSPAYKALREAGLIVDTYCLKSGADLDIEPANADMSTNVCRLAASSIILPVLGGFLYSAAVKQFCVKEGHIRCGTNADGSFAFFGAGVHRIRDAFLKVERDDRSLTEPLIQHGNRTIVTVSQGFVGLGFDRGQPVILPPDLHQWRSDTLRFQEMIDLSMAVIRIGPFTLLTVDEGYAAVTQNNGKQHVLPGGHTHMLTHRNWKFESFISMKIHTDDLGPFSATTADNVVLTTSATVNWRIEDPARAALMGADTMPSEVNGTAKKGNLDAQPDLRGDVLKQTLASLAAAIGMVRCSDSTHVSANEKVTAIEEAESLRLSNSGEVAGLAEIFGPSQMVSAARHANEICSQYGVHVVNINVISAFPSDKQLQQALGAGAVASAAAQQAEVTARGNANAKLIASEADAAAARIAAQAAGDAERLQAQGKKEAAALLEASEVAVDFAKIERACELIGDKSTFFFGAGRQVLPALLSNPKFSS